MVGLPFDHPCLWCQLTWYCQKDSHSNWENINLFDCLLLLLWWPENNESRWSPLVVCALVAQSCPRLCDSRDCSLPDFSVHGILQARILEWVAIPFSRESSWPRDLTQVSWIAGRLFTEPSGKISLLCREKNYGLASVLFLQSWHPKPAHSFTVLQKSPLSLPSFPDFIGQLSGEDQG